MKVLVIWSILTLGLSFIQQERVFICKSGSAYAYHKTIKCRWLQNCTHKIVEVSVAEAKNELKRKPCRPCYGL